MFLIYSWPNGFDPSITGHFQEVHVSEDDETCLYCRCDVTRGQGVHASKLFLNLAKTEWIIFARDKKALPNIEPLKINGIHLNRCESFKCLGIYLDEHLNWNKHVNHICNKINSNKYLKQYQTYVTHQKSKGFLFCTHK